VRGLTQVVNQSAYPYAFSTYRNSDFSTIKGLELRFDMRRMRNVGLQFSYTLAEATGTGSNPNSQANIAWFDSDRPLTASPLDFDQRHKLVGIFDFHLGDHEGPMLGKAHPFSNTGLNVTVQAGSGLPYTPTEVWNEVTLAANRGPVDGPVNSRYSGWRMQVDLKATKTFRLAGSQMEFQLWVVNLFNQENILTVFQSTGEPNSTGWLETDEGQTFLNEFDEPHDSSNLTGAEKYSIRENDPNNYDVPRQVRVGLKLMF
jgi:hypothetical protein